ncbi:MAG: Wzt carbohydrate-binding domain-containing protein, partial [Lachnospiraceae bacterium]|nr:Wzt carbohydrate-binding domain-containing protein [Lachnospiraceae bacterium]
AATAVRPDILLVDEALSVGDVFFQQKCWRRMREFAGSCTILFVSHDMNAVTKFCPRTLVLDGGQLVFDGPSRDAVSAFYRIAQVPEMKKHKTGRKRIGTDPKAEAAICAADKRTEGVEYGVDPFAGRDVRSLYHAADASACSGAGDAVIEEYIWKVDEELLAEVCTSNQRIGIGMTITLRRRMESVIIGYQVRDRFGTEVFGETSLTSGFGSPAFEAGRIKVFFSFRWPEIREGDYFITLGIGEGSEVLCQTEQCWVNQAIHMKSFPEGNKLIYGLLNREMEHFSVVKGNIHL